MESTWASGAVELLRHTDSHVELHAAFDKRIAFISIDNCIETVIRTFLSMPSEKSGIKVTRKELEDAGSSFPKLLSLLYKQASDRLVGIDETDIEHYHRIRNKLYHDGTGLSVDEQYLKAFRGIAGVLLQNLFDVAPAELTSEKATLEGLIVNWNTIEQLIKQKLKERGVASTYNWQGAFAAGVVDPADVKTLTELRIARNRLVHSEAIDKSALSYWTKRSDQLLQKLQKQALQQDAASPADVEIGYEKIEISQERHNYSLVMSVTLKETPDQDFFQINILWPRWCWQPAKVGHFC